MNAAPSFLSFATATHLSAPPTSDFSDIYRYAQLGEADDLAEELERCGFAPVVGSSSSSDTVAAASSPPPLPQPPRQGGIFASLVSRGIACVRSQQPMTSHPTPFPASTQGTHVQFPSHFVNATATMTANSCNGGVSSTGSNGTAIDERQAAVRRLCLFTALCWACRYGQLDAARLLVERYGAEAALDAYACSRVLPPRERAVYHHSPLYVACDAGHEVTVRYLLEGAPRMDPNTTFEETHATRRHPHTAGAGAALSEPTHANKSACCPHRMSVCLRRAIHSGRHGVVDLLLRHGAHMRPRPPSSPVAASPSSYMGTCGPIDVDDRSGNATCVLPHRCTAETCIRHHGDGNVSAAGVPSSSTLASSSASASSPSPSSPPREPCDVSECPIAFAFRCSTPAVLRVLLAHGADACLDLSRIALPAANAVGDASPIVAALRALLDNGADVDVRIAVPVGAVTAEGTVTAAVADPSSSSLSSPARGLGGLSETIGEKVRRTYGTVSSGDDDDASPNHMGAYEGNAIDRLLRSEGADV